MEITNSMRRCLILLEQYDEAVRVWSGPRGYDWSWRINGTAMSYGVDRCIRAGLVRDEGRDRVVLSSLGRKVLAEILRGERPEGGASRHGRELAG